MPESFLGDGLVFEEALPVVWTEGALAEGLVLARLNSDNHQLLGAEASLDEVRVHEALKDESPALVHELQRLEYKVNILLRLTAELALRNAGLPAPQRVKLTSRALEWFGDETPALGSSGLLAVYINSALPQPVRIPCVVAGERRQENLRVAQMRFIGLSDAVIEQLEKLIFRHHRRLVAGARLAAN
ncbi:MAG: PilZ domain-containing protein [Steroidobacteraceae bacterium]